MDILEMHDRALDETARIADGVGSDQFNLPTPCTQWDVRALLRHMVAGNLRFAALAEGTPLTRGPVTENVLGDNPGRAFRESAEAMKRAWRQRGRLEGMYELPIGTLPGQAALTLRLNEAILHGWDLAKATGQAPSYDDDLVAAALQFSEARLPRERPPGGPFASAVDCPDDAPAVDRLAAYMGRQP